MDEYIEKLKARLAELDAAIADAVANGASYSISGSHSVTRVSLAELRAERTATVKRLTVALGGSASCRYTEVPRYE